MSISFYIEFTESTPEEQRTIDFGSKWDWAKNQYDISVFDSSNPPVEVTTATGIVNLLVEPNGTSKRIASAKNVNLATDEYWGFDPFYFDTQKAIFGVSGLNPGYKVRVSAKRG